jgi:predicted membrane-bound spermidine synthase
VSSSATWRSVLYAVIITLTSALLMVLEMVAGRLIAPYVGVSLYTWTAVIGVVLAGLSVGNWLGGVWADRGGSERGVAAVLIAAGIATLLSIVWLGAVAGPIQQAAISLLAASLLLTAALFFLPALLLGVVAPMLTTLALALSSRTGQTVGTLHALAAAGSIAGTFAAGYWLIPAWGSRTLIVASGITLIVLALPLVRRTPLLIGGVATLVILTLLATSASGGLRSPCDRESSYFCIRVVSDEWSMPAGETRSLVLDHLLHGINHSSEPTLLIAPYVQLIDELIAHQLDGEEAEGIFFIGGGAYTQPRALRHRYPEAELHVAELDPLVTRVASEQLFLDIDEMVIEHHDARVVLNRLEGKRFDAIIGDAFHDIAIPWHLVTSEFAELVRQRLKPGGIYLLNVVDAFPDGRLVKSMVATLSQHFNAVEVWLDTLPEEPVRVTYVIAAADRLATLPPRLEAQRGLPREWFRITEPLLATGTPLDQLPVLSDDHAPVEGLLSTLFVSSLGR